MARARKAKRVKSQGPVKISIHGRGVDIDASFDGFPELGDKIAEFGDVVAGRIVAGGMRSESTPAPTRGVAPARSTEEIVGAMITMIGELDVDSLETINNALGARIDMLEAEARERDARAETVPS